MLLWLIYAGVLLYFETVFHLGSYGPTAVNPLLAMGTIAIVASIQTLVTGSLSGRKEKVVFGLFMLLDFLPFFVQTVYYHIFAQPLLLAAVFLGAKDAFTYYWREGLLGLAQVAHLILLYLLAPVGLTILRVTKRWQPKVLTNLQKLRTVLLLVVGSCSLFCTLFIGRALKAQFAEDYLEFYDPATVMERMGVLVLDHRDAVYTLETALGHEAAPTEDAGEEQEFQVVQMPISTPKPTPKPTPAPAKEGEDSAGQESEEEISEPVEVNRDPYLFELDYDKLTQMSGNKKETKWLAQYFAATAPTTRNEYTGMFEGYNLVFLTAEGFSTYAIREDLTPTLYKLVNSGIVCENYYVPIWATSTSDGEYVNNTGLIPDGQFSMRTSSEKDMLYTLPRYFAAAGVQARAFHNNSLSYYDRYLTHPNLGYDFYGIKRGGLPASEWGSHIFTVETPDAWPASDYEMMESTVPMYVNDDRFFTYYMTISGHMNYNFRGNRMAVRNKDAVANLGMSENAEAYIACNIELDKALESLIRQLEEAGKLENTVICLSADHYPYGMTEEQYEELAGKDLSKDLDLYRNSLILWNASMEEPIVVDKSCCSVDVLPTLLNLFGFDYDSRLYAGRDIFSDEEGVVIMKDQSFVTDTAAYDKKARTTTWKRELSEEEQSAYLEAMKQEVKNRYLFSAYMLRNNYYKTVSECILSSDLNNMHTEAQ